MRNYLIVLTLCVITLTTSNVFAEKFDESRRTERLGLSFFDGRPLYFAYLYGRPTVMGAVEYRIETYRVYTGDVLEDLGRYDEASGGVYPPSQDGMAAWCFYARADDGQLTLICSGQYDNIVNKKPDHWVSQALLNFDPGVSSGDIGVYAFDAISERLKPWLLPALGVALALFGVRYCYRLLVRMVQGESGVGLVGSNDSSVSASRGDDSFSGDYSRTSGLATSDNAWERGDVSNADEYATGKAFGREFTPKAVASNVDLQNEWSRLLEEERTELLGDAFEGDFVGRMYPRR